MRDPVLMSLDEAEVPESLRRIAERDEALFNNRDSMPDITPAVCALSFVYERTDGSMRTLADLWAAGPIPIPAKEEVLQLHEEYVRVVSVHNSYTLAEGGPVRGRVEVFTIVKVVPVKEP